MGSTFGAYNIAATGMYVNHSALAVVSSNLSNINTSGYSRKQVAAAEQAVVLPGGQSSGTGVSLAEVRRARDTLLDQTYRRENGTASYWETKYNNFEAIQETLSEFTANNTSSTSTASSNGLQQTLTDFFNAWGELAKDSSSESNRQLVVEDGCVLISTLQDIDTQLAQMQYIGSQKAADDVATLNDLAQQVAKLNSQIMQQELNGGEAGDLRDQRDQLLDQMSGLANITVSENANGVLEVDIGGVALVRGSDTRQLTAAGDGSGQNPLKVQWADLGMEADITSGSIKAWLEDADQSGVQDITAFPYNFSASSASSISNLRQGLNDLISTIAYEVNALHTSGKDLNGDPGVAFFVPVDASKPLSLSNIQVNPALDDPDKVVAGASGEAGDNTIATQIYNLTGEKDFEFDGLSMDMTGFYQGLVSWVATAGSDASGAYDTQNALVMQVNNQRQAISAVSMDEEMSKMIMYQNAYGAAARVLSTIDSLIGGLIQDLGG